MFDSGRDYRWIVWSLQRSNPCIFRAWGSEGVGTALLIKQLANAIKCALDSRRDSSSSSSRSKSRLDRFQPLPSFRNFQWCLWPFWQHRRFFGVKTEATQHCRTKRETPEYWKTKEISCSMYAWRGVQKVDFATRRRRGKNKARRGEARRVEAEWPAKTNSVQRVVWAMQPF